MRMNISDIVVKKRVRKTTGNLEPLKDSLKRYGLLNPITINTRNELVAGQRRLEAAKQLGWTTIEAVVVEPANEIEQLEIELEENTQRENFSDDELLSGYEKLQRLKYPGFWRRLWNSIRAFFICLINKIRGK